MSGVKRWTWEELKDADMDVDGCCNGMQPNDGAYDPVKTPVHYTQGPVECRDAIRSALTEEEWRGYVKGSALAYIWRERLKGGDTDLEKAETYLTWITQCQK